MNNRSIINSKITYEQSFNNRGREPTPSALECHSGLQPTNPAPHWNQAFHGIFQLTVQSHTKCLV